MVPEETPSTGAEQNDSSRPAFPGQRGRRSGRGRRGRTRRPAPPGATGVPAGDDDQNRGPARPADDYPPRPARSDDYGDADDRAPLRDRDDDFAYEEHREADVLGDEEPGAVPATREPNPARSADFDDGHGEPSAQEEPEPGDAIREEADPAPGDQPEFTEARDPAPAAARLKPRDGARREDSRGEAGETGAEPARERWREREDRRPEPSAAARAPYRPPTPEREERPVTPPPPPAQPASPAAIREAIEEVNQVLESLRLAIEDLEDVADTLELAERQKTADEQEIEALKRALRQFRGGRDREGGSRR